MISSDRDWDLMITEDVSRFSYVTRKETTLENWNEIYEFPVEEYITFKCLTGDKGDNVPGINGIGPKRATSIMASHGSVFDIFDACPIAGKYKYIQELNANAEQLLVNVELMDLLTYCEEAIGAENVTNIVDMMKEYKNVV
jgi:DNA polymerase-1